MKSATLLGALAAALSLIAAGAHAAWPDKPIKIVVPFPSGGASDATARALGQTLAKRFGQPVLVENRPGASGAVAAQAVLASPPDGYTVLWTAASMVALPYLQKKPPYRALTEMSPVAAVGRLPFCFFVHPSVAAHSVAEFKEEGSRNPGKLNFATGSVSEFMAMARLNEASGARMQHVPYKGGAQLMPDLVAGRVHVNIGPCSTGMPFVNTGQLRVLATLLPARSALLPDVPTATEAGMPELSAPTWQALVAPPGTPKHVVERLAGAVAEALADAGTLAQLERLGVAPEFASPAELDARMRQEAPLWERFIRESAIEAE